MKQGSAAGMFSCKAKVLRLGSWNECPPITNFRLMIVKNSENYILENSGRLHVYDYIEKARQSRECAGDPEVHSYQ